MPFVKEAFETLGETLVLDGRAIRAEHVRDARLLAVRSTTPVNRELLEDSTVEFVGTATIGFDHIDTEYLRSRGIRWCYSPGCNANSVSEYIVAALLNLAVRHGLSLEGKTIGIVGVGNVGSLVLEKAEILGMHVLPNDPPREREQSRVASRESRVNANAQGTELPPPKFVSLDRVLDEADVVTMHVPLTREGQDATFHLADDAFFGRMKPGGIFINSSRGAVVETNALLKAIDAGSVAHAVIDTWEGEPAIRQDLLDRVDVGTPHIAGYSFDGKVTGTVMVYRQACEFLGVEPAWSPERLLPEPPVPRVEIDAAGRRREEVLHEVVSRVYDIGKDDARLRACPGQDDAARGAYFDDLRREYPERREFRYTRVDVSGDSDLAQKLARLGFVVQ